MAAVSHSLTALSCINQYITSLVMSISRPSPVLNHALPLPVFKKFGNRRIVLASASPRRKDILETAGLRPEIIPSKFAEDLPKAEFEGRLGDYPIATAGEKVCRPFPGVLKLMWQAIEVYERLIQENDRDPADLVISGQLDHWSKERGLI